MTISDDVLKKAKDWLLENSPSWTTGVCRGRVWDTKGGYISGEDYPYCHAWIGHAYIPRMKKERGLHGTPWNSPYEDDATDFIVLTCHSKVRSRSVCSAKACDDLVRWIAHDSPFSRFVLNRDDDDSLTKGGVVLLCGPNGLSWSQSMWVCKVLRLAVEGGKAADTFSELLSAGVDGMLAVFIASYVRTVKGATFGYTGLEAHSTVVYNGSALLVGMLERNLNPQADSTGTVFTPATDKKWVGPSPEAAIRGFCAPVQRSDGWGGKLSSEGLSAEKSLFIERVLKWQDKLSPFFNPPVSSLPAVADTSGAFLDMDM